MDIFLTALATIFSNLGTALRVSVVPFMIGAMVSIGIIFAVGYGEIFTDPFFMNLTMIEESWPHLLLLALILLVVNTILFAIVAINWHQAILYNQEVGLFPKFQGLPIARYIGRLVLLTIILILVGFLAMLAVGMFLALFGTLGWVGLAIGGLLGLIATAFITSVWYRMASTLPSIAVGNVPTFTDGFAWTEDIQLQVLWAAVCTIVFGFLLGFLTLPFEDYFWITNAISLATNWLTTMLGLAILTVIYSRTGFQQPD